MKAIRECVFETNSSSTHSISIYKWKPTKESSIPLNSKIDINGTISAQTEIKDEIGKLNYIIVILASIAESRSYDSRMTEKDKKFNKLINSDHFIWLKEVVKEKCNTEITYVEKYNYFPYFETTYDDDRDIEEILECNIDNEKEFKERVTEIIFDENYIIEDKENEY